MHTVPNINQPITLTDVQDRVYASRVEDAGPGTLVVARPLQLPIEDAPEVGAELLIAWTMDRGVTVLPGRIVDTRRDGSLRLWVVEVTGESWHDQRRQYVRVPALGQVTLLVCGDDQGAEPTLGQLVDVSEAALCCSVDARSTDGLLGEGVRLTSRFRLGREFDLPGRITHRRPARRSPTLAELVVQFDTTGRQADELRREVFAQELRLRRTAAE